MFFVLIHCMDEVEDFFSFSFFSLFWSSYSCTNLTNPFFHIITIPCWSKTDWQFEQIFFRKISRECACRLPPQILDRVFAQSMKLYLNNIDSLDLDKSGLESDPWNNRYIYSEPCLKRPLKKKTKNWFSIAIIT